MDAIMKIIQITLAALALTGCATTPQAQSLRNQLVGTWEFVVAEVTAPDGKKSYPFGKAPKGLLIFTSDGRFSQIHVGDVPRIASNNRMTGTPEEYGAIMRGSLSVFGTYRVDEEKKTVTYKIVSSSFPNWEGRCRHARSTSSPPTSSSTPTRTWLEAADPCRMSTCARSSADRGRNPAIRPHLVCSDMGTR
jgi:hypothetical protein